MTAVKCWRQSDLIISHLPLCPGLHIVLKYVLSNQLDRKPIQKTQNTKTKRKREKQQKHTSRQAIVENEKQTSPFHSMALPSWMARDGKIFEHLKVFLINSNLVEYGDAVRRVVVPQQHRHLHLPAELWPAKHVNVFFGGIVFFSCLGQLNRWPCQWVIN